jgi:hypothetical protein
MINKTRMSDSIALPPGRICIGISGHRGGNAEFASNLEMISKQLNGLFAIVDQVIKRQKDVHAKTRLVSPLAQGSDLMAADLALARGWDVCAPLPFGLDLNFAINLDGAAPEEIFAFLDGKAGCSPETLAQLSYMQSIAGKTRRFELAEQDILVARLLRASLQNPDDTAESRALATITSDRAAAASRIMIEQSNILIAIWDGVTLGATGGTRHSMSLALSLGVPVIWIDASEPKRWTLMREPEAIAATHSGMPRLGALDADALFDSILNPLASDKNERAIGFHTEQWHPKSRRRFHAYRRTEKIFGGEPASLSFTSLVQHYETPGEIKQGTAAGFLSEANALPGVEIPFVQTIEQEALRRFAWADGLSTYLSDAYRGGMVMNFLLSACAIMGGIAYLPFAGIDMKWPFALFEFTLLLAILAITSVGRRKNWHRRWFQTRRVAEYFRHAPIMLLLGVARSAGRWPRGKDSEWPEHYVREVLEAIGLPQVVITQAYLRAALEQLLAVHTRQQRIYHQAKAIRLTKVHHNLDRISEVLFILAVTSVTIYLALISGEMAGLVPGAIVHGLSKTFTFMGVAFPALGGAFAGIRYFGDFERFAAISEVAAEKLAEVERRIDILIKHPQSTLQYSQIAELVHTIDNIMVSEIENWQAVFGGKQITVPV